MNLIDLTGHKFGRLTVISKAHTNSNKQVCWNVVCSCGTYKVVTGNSMKSGGTKSCGCHKSEITKTRNEINRKYSRVNPCCTECGASLNATNWWPSWMSMFVPVCITCGKERHVLTDTKEKQKNRSLRNKYGITLGDYNIMLERQKHVCAICGSPATVDQRAFHVDHCHKTGKIRGILCNGCNAGLGHFKDDPSVLLRAATYIKEHYEQGEDQDK